MEKLLEASTAWLQRRVTQAVRDAGRDTGPELELFRTLTDCRKTLVQRNANPQMVAERALLALREACA